MRRGGWTAVALVAALALVPAACGASGDESSAGEESEATSASSTTAAAATSGTYGDLQRVCGPGDASLARGQGGTSGSGTVRIGVATDRSSDIRPGLNKDMWDASVAFAEWCNAAGGIRGLRIEPVELDGGLFNVESAMTTACSQVFAMVGGGFVQDQLEFSGKEASDFHKCRMIDIPGYAVSVEKSGSNGHVQPVPNVPTSQAVTWMRDYQQLEPEDSKKVAIAHGELPTLDAQKDKYIAGLEEVGMELVDTFGYPAAGMTDWTPLAQRIIESGATTLIWVGEPNNLSSLLDKLHEQGWKGTPLLETNMYDKMLFSAGTEGAEGAVIRMSLHPLEEASRWPATRQYLDTLGKYVPDFTTGALGVQATSAWLLFATAANACAEQNDGVIDRTCVLEQAAAQQDWTGGGLHSPQDPAAHDEATASPCGMLVTVTDGEFERLYPELDSRADDVDGFHCPDDGVVTIPENEGQGEVDPDRPL